LGFGMAGATAAGLVSALLGIGGGIIKVPVMNLAMGVPFRVATATSNMMIGITAAASAIIYLVRGGIDPYVVGPTAIGVFLGATVGSRVSHRVDLRLLRLLFVIVLVWLAIEMIGRGLG
ncbi:MAG: sulfite exporter TauE/SafE family protein, partial [Chloroflexota bacterium]